MTLPVILHLNHISCQFDRAERPAVDQVDLELHEGDILGLLGPSGCGKTTLLRLVAGFETPKTGTISILDQPVAGQGRWMPPERRDIGMVFQDYALFPHLTVEKNILFGLERSHRKSGSTAKAQRDRAQEVLTLVGLRGFEQRYPHELSGGQQQRVALARALAPCPSLILLDEPLSNLDMQVRLRLRQDIRDILKATRTSAIFVTHDQEEALAIADRVAVMQQGQIEQIGSPEEIYHQPASRFVAQFVTQANFLRTQRRGDVWETEIGQFSVQPIHCTCKADWEICQTEANSGELMIRQEDLQLEGHPTGQLVVRDRQFLGRDYCYCLQTESGLVLQARPSAPVRLVPGDRVNITVANQALRFFPDLPISPASQRVTTTSVRSVSA